MFSLTSLCNAAPERPRRLLRRALLLGGGLLVLFLVIQLLPASAPAASGPANSPANDAGTVAVSPDRLAASRGSVFSFGNVAAALLLLGGGAVALYLRQRSPQPTGASAPIQSLGQMPLAQGQQLRLVACGGEVLLLGVAADQVTLLKSFSHAAFADHPVLSPNAEVEAQPEPPGFSDVLRRFAQHVAPS